MKDEKFYQKLKLIGWLQLIGGVCGIGIVSWEMTPSGGISGPLFPVLLIGLGLYLFSIYSGSLMLKSGNEKKAIILSIVNQSLQIVQFKMLGIGLGYSTLFPVTFGYNPPNIQLAFNVISFSGNFNGSNDFLLLVNITAVLICGTLLTLLDILKSNVPEIAD